MAIQLSRAYFNILYILPSPLHLPTIAEYMFSTPSGVMSIDFHPEHASLLVAGLYDGSVVAFDIYSKSRQPIFKSTVRNGKHTDPVWQVDKEPT